jgi:hypothetical protein
MRRFLLTILLFCPTLVTANTYIYFNNEVPFQDFKSQESNSYLRLGHKFDNNFYIEGGPATYGSSYEAGYQVTTGRWTFKGKWEGEDSNESQHFDSKIETEIKYTFGD